MTRQTNAAPPEDATKTAWRAARTVQLVEANDEIQKRVRAGKQKQQEAARIFRQKFVGLFPEQAGNALLNEYFAYAELIGEKVDHKRLTVAEGQYELARKASEIHERQARLQADMAATQAAKATEEAAGKRASEEISARRAADEAAVRRAGEEAERRLAIDQQLLEQQQQIQRQQRLEYLERQQRLADKQRQENLQTFLRLLSPPKPKMTTCTGGWMGPTWTSNCTAW
jgi:hypothetical protein